MVDVTTNEDCENFKILRKRWTVIELAQNKNDDFDSFSKDGNKREARRKNRMRLTIPFIIALLNDALERNR